MGRQGRRTLTALGLTLALLLGTANVAGGAGSLPPLDVSASAGDGSAACVLFDAQPGIAGVDVAANERGDTVVSWTRNAGGGNQMVQAAFRPAGGAFGAPQDIGLTKPCYFFGLLGATPDVAIDAAGGAVVVFPASGAGGNTVIRGALMPAGGVFAAPQDLSSDTQPADEDAHVAMNASGAAVATWTRSNGANRIVQASTRQPGQAFAPPVPLSLAGADAKTARVAVNDAGAAAVAWVRGDGSTDIAQARVRPAGQPSFVATQDLSVAGPAGQNARSPDIAVDPTGVATIVWARPDGTQTRVQSRFLTPNGEIGAGIDDVSDPGDDGSNPSLAVDRLNTAVAVFAACPTAGGSCAVKSATRPSGGSFGNVETISPPSDDSVSPKVAIDPSGVATAVFSPFTTNAQTLLTRRPAGGTFGSVQPISPSPGSGLFPSLAADGEGNVLVGWTFRSSAPGNPQTAQVSAFDAAAPTLAAVSVPSSGTAGQGVGMAAAATDRWSPVSLAWSFGDGTTGAGGAVTHAFGASGAFDVTVTATDGVGNATSATRPIAVSPAPVPPKKRITAKVRVTWGVSGRKIFLLRLNVPKALKGTKVELRCAGKKCPFKRKSSKKRRKGTITLFREVKAAKVAGMKQRSFRAGQRLELRITKKGFIGKVVRYKLKKGKIPSGKNLCLPVAAKKPRSRCP